ncbi:hypothetical protein WA538_005229 [Blastocystis sp. DL]
MNKSRETSRVIGRQSTTIDDTSDRRESRVAVPIEEEPDNGCPRESSEVIPLKNSTNTDQSETQSVYYPSAMKKSVPVDQLQYSTMGQDTIPEQQTQPVYPSAMKKSVPVDQLQYSTMGQDTIPEQQTQPVYPSAMKKVEIVDQPPINSSQQSNPRDSTFWQSAMQSSQPMDQPPINSSQQSNPHDSTFWQSAMQSSQPYNSSVPPSDADNIRRSYQSRSSHDNSQPSSLRSSILPSVPNTHIIDNTSSIRRSLKKEDNGNANPE